MPLFSPLSSLSSFSHTYTHTQAERFELVKRLLAKFPDLRATINEADVFGRTPIIWTAMKGNLEMAGLLVDYDANITHLDTYGKDASDYAGAAGFADLARVCVCVWIRSWLAH